MRDVLFVMASCGLLTISSMSGANENSDKGLNETPDKEIARTLLKQGIEAFETGDHSAALKYFREAYEKHADWRLLFNIGQCEAVLKRYGQALDTFENYLVVGGDEIPLERQRQLQEELDRLRRLSGELRVTAPPGAIVLIDGEKRGQTPLPGSIRIAAGLHTVKVLKDNSVLLEQEVRIHGRGKSELKVVEPPSRTSDNSEKAFRTKAVVSPESSGGQPKIIRHKGLIIGLISGGAALLVGSVVTGAMGLAEMNDLNDACPSKSCSSQDDLELRDKVRALKIATDVLWPIGAVMATSGVVLWLIQGKKGEKQANKMHMSPVISAAHRGFLLEGSF